MSFIEFTERRGKKTFRVLVNVDQITHADYDEDRQSVSIWVRDTEKHYVLKQPEEVDAAMETLRKYT